MFSNLDLNWRLVVIRVLVNGIVIALTAWLLPGIDVLKWGFGTYLILGAIFGLLNAFVKPIVQFLTLPLIFVTYGLVVVVINTVMLALLEWLLPGFLAVNGFWWYVLGGIVMGLLTMILESLLGMTPPIVDDSEDLAQEALS